jgi:hypothetical protein
VLRHDENVDIVRRMLSRRSVPSIKKPRLTQPHTAGSLSPKCPALAHGSLLFSMEGEMDLLCLGTRDKAESW